MSFPASQLDNWWKPALHISRDAWRLRRFLLTTYGAPDASLLVNTLLPDWLGVPPPIDGPRRDDAMHGLVRALHDVEGVVVTDSPFDTEDAHRWLWNHVRTTQVGWQTRHSVQHAKLWLLEYENDGETVIAVWISSANLSSDACQGQVQLGWRAIVPLTPSRPGPWSGLGVFLKALAKDVEPDLSGLVTSWHKAAGTMGRVLGLRGVVPCIPEGGRQAGVAALKSLLGTSLKSLRIASPFLGQWQDAALSTWFRELGTPAARTRLLLARDPGPSARLAPGWTNWCPAADQVERLNGCMPVDRLDLLDPLKGEERATSRWFHGKTLVARPAQGMGWRSYVGSANWSESAWGIRTTQAGVGRRFELGVVLEQDKDPWPFKPCPGTDALWMQDHPKVIKRSTPPPLIALRIDRKGTKHWLVVTSRDLEPGALIRLIYPRGRSTTHRLIGLVTRILLPGRAEALPVEAHMRWAGGELLIPVQKRPQMDGDTLPPWSLDRDLDETWRQTFAETLERRYCGQVITRTKNEPPPRTRTTKRKTASDDVDRDPYRLAWLDRARLLERCLDAWWAALLKSGSSGSASGAAFAAVRHDGLCLSKHWSARGKEAHGAADQAVFARAAREIDSRLRRSSQGSRR